MRIGGPFPFGEGVMDVALGGGGVFYPLPGNYIANLGLVTVLQTWDNSVQEWRNFAQPATQSMPFATDGYNWRLVNMSGVTIGARVTNAGSGGTNGIGATATGSTVTFGAPASGRTALGYPIVGGSINTTVTITQAGSGFLVPPRLIFSAPPAGGIRATGYCTLTGTTIGAVTVTNAGAGYTTAPTCYIYPQAQFYQGAGSPGGAAGAVPAPGLVAAGSLPPDIPSVVAAAGTTGALLTVNATLTGSGTLTGIGMYDYGSGYDGTHIPTVTLGGTSLGSAAATAIMAMSVTSVTLGVGGAVYGSTSPIWMSSLGDVVTTGTHYRDAYNNTMIPRAARGIATLSSGVVTAYTIEDPGFALQSVPVIAVMSTSSLATGIANGTAVCGGIDDVSFLQNAVQ